MQHFNQVHSAEVNSRMESILQLDLPQWIPKSKLDYLGDVCCYPLHSYHLRSPAWKPSEDLIALSGQCPWGWSHDSLSTWRFLKFYSLLTRRPGRSRHQWRKEGVLISRSAAALGLAVRWLQRRDHYWSRSIQDLWIQPWFHIYEFIYGNSAIISQNSL